MALSRHALTTVATVKDFLRLASEDTEYNSLLERFINAVSEQVEGYCGRHFEKATYTEKYRGNNETELWLNQYPVIEVSYVKILDEEITDGFSIEGEGILYRELGWPDNGKKSIEVSYTAGYVLPKDETVGPPAVERTLPYDLEDAVIELVAARFNLRQEDAAGKSSRIQEDFNVRFEKNIPAHIAAILDKYKKVVV